MPVLCRHCSSSKGGRSVVRVQRNDDEQGNLVLMDDGHLLKKADALIAKSGRIHQREAEKVSLLIDLKSCSIRRDIQWGRRIHVRAVERRHESNMYVATALIKMYAKCGSLVEARRIFDSIQKPDVVCWTALLLGYAENGDGIATLHMFSKMKARGCAPDSVTYVAALKACTSLAKKGDGGQQGESLERGREIHSEIGCDLDIFVQSTLIDMYGNCGSMVDAYRVFDEIEKPNVVCWNALILGYAENGNGLAALKLFSKMKAFGCVPNSITYVAALKACTSLARDGGQDECLNRGREIHSEIGRDMNIFVQNTLIDMYANCGSMVDACRVFFCVQKPDVVSWNAFLLGYVNNGDGFATMELFSKMKTGGCAPNSVTYIAALKACSLIGSLDLGRKLHSEISEFTSQVVLTCLVDFYAKCGSIVEAREVFDAHSRARNVSTWTALLTGYGSFGDTDSVFNLFEAMQDEGFQPDAITFVCLLSCCSHAGLIAKAKEYLKAMPMQYGIIPTVMHYNCMVDILGRANQLKEALDVLREMPCNPDAVTWTSLLGACHKWKNVDIGMWAFRCLVDMNKKNTFAYVLMAQIFSSRGMWEEQERVLEAKMKLGAVQHFGQSYVFDKSGNVVKFVVGEADVKNEIKYLSEKMKQLSEKDFADLYSISCNVADAKLCGHSERRAAVYGILSTPFGEPVRVFKSTRMCDDCHESTKIISKLCEMVIMVRDTSTKFHVMMNGNCSCGDYW